MSKISLKCVIIIRAVAYSENGGEREIVLGVKIWRETHFKILNDFK